LGKYDFRRGATFLLCAHPAPERRPRGTETAGEPQLLRRLDSAVERSGMRGLAEGMKVSYEVQADRRTGKEPATNLKAT
jgi:hypothetical protein